MIPRMSRHNKMHIACGFAHMLALAEHGRSIFTCGRGNHGQLGAGTRQDKRTPTPVAGLELLPDVVMVAAGFYHSAAITSAGSLLLWGDNFYGQLGQGDEDDRLMPVTLCLLQFGGDPVAMVGCGYEHTLVVTGTGRLFAFGKGEEGQLGLGDRTSRDVPVEVGPGCLGRAIIVYAAAGSAHSGVVTSGGRVWTWGTAVQGRLGHNNEEDQLVPRELEGQFGGARARSLAAGGAHTMVLTTCGAVWGFGYGEEGQLGVGDRDDRHAPVRVGGDDAFGQSKVRMVACGSQHTVAATEEGAVWSWGNGAGGRLGHNDNHNRLAPARVGQERFGGVKIVAADCAGARSAAVSEEGALFTWGEANWIGAPAGLGHDDVEDKLVPTLVAPDSLLGARIGRWLPLAPLLALAFAMGTHHRLGAGEAQVAGRCRGGRKSLRAAGKEPAAPAAKREGAGSPLQALAGELGLVRIIVEMCADEVPM